MPEPFATDWHRWTACCRDGGAGNPERMGFMRWFDDDRYAQLADHLRESFASADPFPHVVMDDFLPEEVCEKVLAEFPSPSGSAWRRLDSANQRKLAAQKEAQLGEATRHILREFTSPGCLQFLETLTGIRGLIPDPYFEGGGLHQIEAGGFLKIHADFNKHPRLNL